MFSIEQWPHDDRGCKLVTVYVMRDGETFCSVGRDWGDRLDPLLKDAQFIVDACNAHLQNT